MAITFNEVPSSNRVPAVFYENDGSRALGAQAPDPQQMLLIGFRTTAGTVAAGVLTDILGEADGDLYFGPTSQLAHMCRAFRRVNKQARITAIGVDEDVAGAAAAGSFAFSGTVTKAAPIKVRIGDKRISALLSLGDNATQVASKLEQAIDLVQGLMFTALSSTGTVSLACVHKGEAGNQVSIAIESLPPGLTPTVTQPQGGATNTDLAPTIALIDDTRYDTFVTGLVDAANMLKLENEMARRWSPVVKRPGMVIGGLNGSHGALTTYGTGRNSQYSCIMGSGLSPTPPWIWAAQAAARDAQRNDTQPNQPRKGLVLPDCEAPLKTQRFDDQQRNLLYYDGISSFRVDQSGRVTIDRLITTYQTNNAGQSDATYLAMETMRNLIRLYVEYTTLGAKFDDALLAPDGTNVDPGIKIVTPKSLRGEILALNASQERRGLVKDAAGFAEALIVELNLTDVERIDVQLSSRLIGGLVTLAMKNLFQL